MNSSETNALDLQTLTERLIGELGTYLPSLLAAVAILLIGWLGALVVARIVKAVVGRLELSRRLGIPKDGTGDGPAAWAGRAAFWVTLLLVVVGALQALQLTSVTEPLNRFLGSLFAYMPRLVGAAVLVLVAWVVAKLAKAGTLGLMTAAKVDERLFEKAGLDDDTAPKISTTVADTVYGVVLLLFLPGLLSVLGLTGLLSSVQVLVDEVLAFAPNLLGAGIILLVGWFVARIVRKVITGVLQTVKADALPERLGMTAAVGEWRISEIVGLVAYVFVIVPTVIATLDALAIEAITSPARQMLGRFLDIVPSVVAAAAILGLAFLVGRLIQNLITRVLRSIGFNALAVKLGLSAEAKEDDRWGPSAIVGFVAFVGILLFAGIEASGALGLETLSTLFAELTVFAGRVLLATIILGVALFLGQAASGAVTRSGVANNNILAMCARLSVIIFGGAIALQSLGIADEILGLAFGLTLGAVAVAFALAVGLGGREVAGRELDILVKKLRGTNDNGAS